MLDIWYVDAVGLQDWLLEQGHLAGHAERERSQRFFSPADAADFLSSHVALRLILQRYSRATGEYCRNPAGKPHLPGAPQFSLSRTRGAVLVAVSDRAVGVDIERSRAVELTERAVHRVARAANLPLLTAWTMMEAWSKWQGTGIAALIRRLDGLEETSREWCESAEPQLSWACFRDRQYTAGICSQARESGRPLCLWELGRSEPQIMTVCEAGGLGSLPPGNPHDRGGVFMPVR